MCQEKIYRNCIDSKPTPGPAMWPALSALRLDLGKRRAAPAAIGLMKARRVMQLGALRPAFVGSDTADEKRMQADLLAMHDGQFPNAQRRRNGRNAPFMRRANRKRKHTPIRQRLLVMLAELVNN